MREPFKFNVHMNHGRMLVKYGFCSVGLRSVQDSVSDELPGDVYASQLALSGKAFEVHILAEEKQFTLRQNQRLRTI